MLRIIFSFYWQISVRILRLLFPATGKKKTFLLIAFAIWGSVGYNGEGSDKFYKAWENSSIVFTIIYSVVFYIEGFFTGRFDKLSARRTGVIVALIFFILLCYSPFLLIFLFDILNFTHNIVYNFFHPFFFGVNIYYKWVDGSCVEGLRTIPVPWSLFFICLSGIAFCTIDTLMIDNTNPSQSALDRALLHYIDFPMTIVFVLMELYAIGICVLHPGFLPKAEPFFSGAIAFQMLLSNLVWIIGENWSATATNS